MNKVCKICLILTFFVILFGQINNVYAAGSGFSIDDVFRLGDNFVQEGQKEYQNSSGIDMANLHSASSVIANTFISIGIVLTVIVGGILGIKFMMEGAEEKAKIKEAMIPYVVGCVIIFGAFGIWKLTIYLSQDIYPTPQVQNNYTKATEAKNYINAGKDIKAVSNEELLSWYGELSRLQDKSESMKEYYNKVKAEINRRRLYE